MRSTTSTQSTWLLAATLMAIAGIVLAVIGSVAIGLVLVAIAAMFAVFAFTMSKGPG